MPTCFRALLTAFLACAGLSAQSSEIEELRKELLATKQEYQQRIQKLEQRLEELASRDQALQAQIDENKTRSVTAATTAQQALQTAHENRTRLDQLGTTPLFDVVDPVERKPFEFKGYARSGFGLNGLGGQMVTFKAPDVPARYRLGNEPDTYAEMVFINNWLPEEHGAGKPWFRTEVMVMAATKNFNTFDPSSDFKFREAFGQAGNLSSGYFRDAKVWAGLRYYRREQIYINDFWYLDMSGYGGGIEDVRLPHGRTSIAYIGAASPTALTSIGNVPKSNLDVRWTDLKLLGGDVTLWYNFASAKIGSVTTSGEGLPAATGNNFGFEHKRTEFYGGYQNFSIQTGSGAASNLVATVQTPSRYWQNARTLLITDNALIQPNDRFSIQPAFVAAWHKPGDPGVPYGQWFSFGARPVIYLTKYISLGFEPGFDYVKDSRGQYEGWVRKFTIAPMIQPVRDFWSRPQLRLFVTWANWSPGLKGYVGTPVYSNRTNGMSAGIQVESWW